MIEDLQEKLRRFRTELADVDMENRANLQVNIQGFLRFADYDFDRRIKEIRTAFLTGQ